MLIGLTHTFGTFGRNKVSCIYMKREWIFLSMDFSLSTKCESFRNKTNDYYHKGPKY